MAEGSLQAPAGWYEDPHTPGRMRYFDGELWTNHFHNPGQLPDIGSWLSSTFAVFGAYWPGAVIIAVCTTLIGNLAAWTMIVALTNDLVVIDEELVGLSIGSVILGVVAVVFGVLWQGFGWLTLNRYMQRAHFQSNPTVGEAVRHALKRLPKYVGVMLRLATAALLALVILAVVTLASPFVGVFVIGLVIVAAVWVFVKLSFLSATIAAAPADAPALRTSAAVSTGRFWPVLGRLLLVVIGVGIVANVVGALLGDFGSVIDADVATSAVELSGDELLVSDFTLRDLFPSTPKLFIAIAVTTVIQAASGLISTSATMRLYLDSGAQSELD